MYWQSCAQKGREGGEEGKGGRRVGQMHEKQSTPSLVYYELANNKR